MFSWDTWPPLFLVQLFYTSRRPFLTTFTTKSYLSSEACTVSPNNCFSAGNLFVHRKRRARFRIVSSSYEVMVYFYSSRNRFPMSYLPQNVLHSKPNCDFKVAGSPNCAHIRKSRAKEWPNFLFMGFQGHFYEITLWPFHMSLKIKKSHANTSFQLFSKYVKST